MNEDSRSVGDACRDLDEKGVTSDFYSFVLTWKECGLKEINNANYYVRL